MTKSSDSIRHPMHLAQSDAEIRGCARLMRQLREKYGEDELVQAIEEQMRDGYRLAFVEHDGAVRAVAGFRITQNLAWGRHLYIDDLVSDNASRSRGFGAVLIHGLTEYARSNGCAELHLDSGVHRDRAHRFYFAQGLAVKSFHFSMEIERL